MKKKLAEIVNSVSDFDSKGIDVEKIEQILRTKKNVRDYAFIILLPPLYSRVLTQS